jgi:anti-sigma-K factor RskA
MTWPDAHSLLGPYAVDALDVSDRAGFEGHLATCEYCTAELATLSEATAHLSELSIEPAPEALRGAVLAAIGSTAQTPEPVAAGADPEAVTAVIAAPRHRAGGNARSRRSHGASAWQAVAAACVIIAIAIGAWGFQQHRDARNKASATASQVQQLLQAPDSTLVSGPVGSGHATLVYSIQQDKLILVGHGIPAPPTGKTYQLWEISSDGKTITSAGVFAPDQAGNVVHTVSSGLADTGTMGVSIEPEGGSPQPTDVITTMHI